MAGDTDNALRNILNGAFPKGLSPSPEPQPDEESDALTVTQMDGKYSAMRPANKNLIRLHVMDKAGKVRS